MAPEERIHALLNAPPDGWVAFSEDETKLVAYGATYEEVLAKAEAQGVKDPVLVKIPNDWIERVLVP
jgi:hypothetical protein